MSALRWWFVLGSLIAAPLLGVVGVAGAADAPKKIVLIGGSPSEGPGRHDYPRGIRFLQALLTSSPDAPAGLVVEAYPDGWPDDPAALDGASAVLWYFDGLDKHPLLDTARRARFESLMQRGVGLVALHQASTVPADDRTIDLPRWLGGARYGSFDRTTESAALVPAPHAVTRGVAAFTLSDEFYPSLRFRERPVTPVLSATLHVQYRQGQPVVTDLPEQRAVAWAFERDGGGRAFAYTGAHFLAALDQPALRQLLLNAMFWSAGIDLPAAGMRQGVAADAALPAALLPPDATRVAAPDAPTFHRDAGRSGWNAHETALAPAKVAGPTFGLLWESPPFDTIDGQPPRLYASPLYVDRVTLSAGQHAGATFSVLFAASNAGFVYAVNAFKAGDVAPGRILWRTRLAAPCFLQPAPLDGVATGVLSTPVIDVRRQRLYVTSCDPDQRWQAYALDLTSGALLPGWPVRLDEGTFHRLNRNAGPTVPPPTRRFDYRVQRGALNLSPDGSRLYVTFGETETGWLVSVDTARTAVHSAFASVAVPHRSTGGIWGAGGPAVDEQGQIFVATGSGFNGHSGRPHDWAQSVLKIDDTSADGLTLRATYTPFNHCASATADIDLGSGGVMLLPELAAATTTPRLLAVGGKQGNVYLLDRDRLPGRLDTRPPCSTDPASDASLLAPAPQRALGHRRGPLNVFGPYSEGDAALDAARARSVPAYFRDARGRSFLFVTGSSKQRAGSPANVPPSLARLQVVARRGAPAYLRIHQAERTQVLQNPGSPVVTSNGPRDAIVWVLDPNAPRSAPLVGPGAPRPVLYAFDAMNLKLLWKSRPGELPTSGKYNEPAFARGSVFVGTDRIQAFGLGATASARPADTAVAAPAARPVDTATRTIDAQALYAQRCAVCHEQPQGSVPPRARIAARTPRHIVDVLTVGTMRAQAAGLSHAEIRALARWLTQAP